MAQGKLGFGFYKIGAIIGKASRMENPQKYP